MIGFLRHRSFGIATPLTYRFIDRIFQDLFARSTLCFFVFAPAMKVAAGARSTRIASRPASSAATPVIPEPQKPSRTRSPGTCVVLDQALKISGGTLVWYGWKLYTSCLRSTRNSPEYGGFVVSLTPPVGDFRDSRKAEMNGFGPAVKDGGSETSRTTAGRVMEPKPEVEDPKPGVASAPSSDSRSSSVNLIAGFGAIVERSP